MKFIRNLFIVILFCSLSIFATSFLFAQSPQSKDSSQTVDSLKNSLGNNIKDSSANSSTKNSIDPKGKVFIIEINSDIDLATSLYVKRAVEDAENSHCDAVLLHINTFGGRLDAATEIKDALLNTKLKVLAYVDKRAISAGALICLTAEKIAMSPGASIGAATPVYQDGERASEKVVSYMRGEMRSTAERHNRNPQIAEAMVDENVELADSIKKIGELLSLTTHEAMRLGYCDYEANNLQNAISQFGYSNSNTIKSEANWNETIVGFFTSPIVNGILIMLGLAGLFYGIKTGHLGLVAGIGFLCLALFFGFQYIVKLTDFIEIIMFIVGVALLLLEIFIIPGVGITGLLGVLLIIGSLFMSMLGGFNLIDTHTLQAPIYSLAGAFIGFGVLMFLIIKYMPTSKAFGLLSLQTEQSSKDGFVSSTDYSWLLGLTGKTLTKLRPAGIVEFGNEKFDVISDGDFIDQGVKVVVIKAQAGKIVVRKS